MNHNGSTEEAASIAWRTSSRSGGAGGQNCVAVGLASGHSVAVRDTKHDQSGILKASPAEWNDLLRMLGD